MLPHLFSRSWLLYIVAHIISHNQQSQGRITRNQCATLTVSLQSKQPVQVRVRSYNNMFIAVCMTLWARKVGGHHHTQVLTAITHDPVLLHYWSAVISTLFRRCFRQRRVNATVTIYCLFQGNIDPWYDRINHCSFEPHQAMNRQAVEGRSTAESSSKQTTALMFMV